MRRRLVRRGIAIVLLVYEKILLVRGSFRREARPYIAVAAAGKIAAAVAALVYCPCLQSQIVGIGCLYGP